MARLTLTTFLTLDGVMQGPGTPTEDTRNGFGSGGWLFPYADDDMNRLIGDWYEQADCILLGRHTYELFAAYWPAVTDPAARVASRLNILPKYVASSTLTRTSWANTTIVDGTDLVATVTDLKKRYNREIQIHGSGVLARSLMPHGVIDEYRLWTYPVLLGEGQRLFAEGTPPTALELVAARTTSTGGTAHTYRPVGQPGHGSLVAASEQPPTS